MRKMRRKKKRKKAEDDREKDDQRPGFMNEGEQKEEEKLGENDKDKERRDLSDASSTSSTSTSSFKLQQSSTGRRVLYFGLKKSRIGELYSILLLNIDKMNQSNRLAERKLSLGSSRSEKRLRSQSLIDD